MDNIVDITEILLFKRAIRILETLDIDYDYYKLKTRPDICKEIVALYEDSFELTNEHRRTD